jgi:hypothetical protein
MSSCDTALFKLFEESVTFRLYADYTRGMSVPEIAMLCSRSQHWVEERIEAARLCLEKQVRIVAADGSSLCADSLWAAQVWD